MRREKEGEVGRRRERGGEMRRERGGEMPEEAGRHKNDWQGKEMDPDGKEISQSRRRGRGEEAGAGRVSSFPTC